MQNMSEIIDFVNHNSKEKIDVYLITIVTHNSRSHRMSDFIFGVQVDT